MQKERFKITALYCHKSKVGRDFVFNPEHPTMPICSHAHTSPQLLWGYAVSYNARRWIKANPALTALRRRVPSRDNTAVISISMVTLHKFLGTSRITRYLCTGV